MLSDMRLTNEEVKFLYMIIGCDNTRGIRGLGWQNALKLLKCNFEFYDVNKLYKAVKQVVHKTTKKSVRLALHDAEKLLVELKASSEEASEVELHNLSRIYRFLSERNEEGLLRRPGL